MEKKIGNLLDELKVQMKKTNCQDKRQQFALAYDDLMKVYNRIIYINQ